MVKLQLTLKLSYFVSTYTNLSLQENIWAPAPFVVYGLTGFVASFTSYFLPETTGKPLPETLLEGEAFGK